MSILDTLSGIRPSSTIMTLHGYKSVKSGEVADYQLAFHISYSNALSRSIAALQQVHTNSPLEERARQELIASYECSLANSGKEKEHYTYAVDSTGSIVKGVKIHNKTGQLHLTGSLIRKNVIEPGVYKTVNKQELTLLKDKLREKLPVNKFRQFVIKKDQFESIRVEGMTITL